MKRLAVLVLLTAVIGGANRAAAGESALPLPTGMAPTSPQVPAPIVVDGLPSAQGAEWTRTSFRERLGISSPYVDVSEPSPGPRVWSKVKSTFSFTSKKSEPYMGKPAPAWCENCAPVVRKPLPPLPENLSTIQRVSAVMPAQGPACADGSCTGKSAKSCCERLKEWACFRYSTVRMPLVPTPRDAALYTYSPFGEEPGACGPGGCPAPGKHGKCATGAGCVSCPTVGETVVPGYRLAK